MKGDYSQVSKCESCVHKKVCKFEEDYKKIASEIDLRISDIFVNNAAPFKIKSAIQCEMYSPPIPVQRSQPSGEYVPCALGYELKKLEIT